MSAGTFPFDPERLASLARLSAQINAQSAPTPLAVPVLLDEDGRVLLPVPDNPDSHPDFIRSMMSLLQTTEVWCQLHAGMTLQWAPMVEAGGMLLAMRGGTPDGDAHRDGVAVFLTSTGLDGLIRDLQAIAASLRSSQP